MQTSIATGWKIARSMLFAAVISYAVLVALAIYVFPTKYGDCEKDTKELNGGVKMYGDRKFNVVLCGDGGNENFNHDEIRMQIFSENGTLLAVRKFYVNWGAGPIELTYHDDHLIYADPTRPNDYERKVSMPPTWLDWIRARVPLVD
jgi:hypothetical protein